MVGGGVIGLVGQNNPKVPKKKYNQRGTNRSQEETQASLFPRSFLENDFSDKRPI